MNAKQPDKARRRVAENRKARFNYFISQEIEAGIALVGTEVKSLRAGHANINEAYAEVRDGEVYLVNAHIPEYEFGNRFNHDARRPRKLLLHKREIDRLAGAVIRQGYTLVPLSIYFNDRGRAKVNLGLAKGKQMHDKRAAEKERDWQREKARVLKDYG
ncbi:MAG TPA: SsrA-binding protein SmpB [Sphingomonadales bacterium]